MDFLFDQLKKFGDSAFEFLMRLLVCVVILAVGMWLVKWFMRRFVNSRLYGRLDESLGRFLVSFIRIIMYVLLFITAASVVGIPMTSFVTLLASAGVAIGLALQGALSNLAGGVMILLFKPFKIGDYIEMASGSGTVTDITVFYTMLCTPDNKQITLPNGQLTNAAIINYSANDRRRVDLVFTAAYNSDADKVVSVLLEAAGAHSLVLKDPAPFAALSAQRDRALEFVLRMWCMSGDYWTVNFDIQKSVKRAFDENGIEIPFPQLDVHTN